MASRIDLSRFVQLQMAEIERAMGNLADLVASEWAKIAREDLHTSSPVYVKAITITERGARRIAVSLVGTVPNIVEQGMGPGGVGTSGSYDVGQLLLRETTRQVRRTKDGRLYLNVPMRRSPGDVGRIGGPDVLKQAMALAPSRSRPYEDRVRPPNTNLVRPQDMEYGTRWGGRLEARFQGDPLGGLARLDKEYSTATQGAPQSQFISFRRIIQGGRPWISPGVRARKLSERVLRDIPRMMDIAFGGR